MKPRLSARHFVALALLTVASDGLALPSHLLAADPGFSVLPEADYLSESASSPGSQGRIVEVGEQYASQPEYVPIDQPACTPIGCDCYVAEHWYDNLQLFAGIDGAKQPQDLGVNANLGGRLSSNYGFAIVPDWNLGGQIGVGFNFADSAVAVLERLDGTDNRTQLFTTTGVFQRLDSGWNWALAYDYLNEDYYDDFDLTQWRGRVGYELNPTNEVGVWFAQNDRVDEGTLTGTPVYLETISQINAYWRHQWASTAQTSLWVGIAEEHGEVTWVFPENETADNMAVFGAAIHCPLNSYMAVFGETNLIMPADSGTVDAYLGIVFYPGGRAATALDNTFAPMLPVANNTSFAVDLNR